MEGKRALLWDGEACGLCRRRCRIPEGGTGFCRVRVRRGKDLWSINYGRVVALGLDPIEKKPLYHFLPGSVSLSYACFGCNFACKFCQNWEISQEWRAGDGTFIPAEEMVERALRLGASSISHTYSEPTVFLEYALDVAKLAKGKALRNVFVTNSYITPEALDLIAPYLDGVNADLKAFSPEFYRDLCGGVDFEEILEALKDYHRRGIHLEITTLLIPGKNDSEEEVERLAKWISEELSPEVPIHLTAFHPDYKMMEVPPTPPASIHRAAEVARRYLSFVYPGNLPGPLPPTKCPDCGTVVIRRTWGGPAQVLLEGGRCPKCGRKIPGVWS